jgi:hypothetical protein
MNLAAAGALVATACSSTHTHVPAESSPSCHAVGGDAICPHTIVFAIIAATAYAVSAIYGYSEIHHCRAG